MNLPQTLIENGSQYNQYRHLLVAVRTGSFLLGICPESEVLKFLNIGDAKFLNKGDAKFLNIGDAILLSEPHKSKNNHF